MENNKNQTNSGQNEEIKSQFRQTKFGLTMRMLVGAYLVYTSFSLFGNLENHAGGEKAFFIVAAVVFAVTGMFLVLHSGILCYKGAYVGGKLDEAYFASVAPKTEEEENDTEEVIHVRVSQKQLAEVENDVEK